MNYNESVAYIESLSPTQFKPGLERFAQFMLEHQQLQDRCPSIHVAGTNGKGSVVCMLAETLKQAGFKTGRYTGPHLLSINERYQIDGKEISDSEFAEICTQLKSQSEAFGERHPEHGSLTWFEIITAISFEYFAKEKTDVSVFEVGLGGRWDATSVLTSPVVTSIVTVGLDHMHILGPTVSDIAREKAGILKPGIPVVTACKNIALATIVNAAQEKNVPVICTDFEHGVSSATGSARERSYVEAINKRFTQLNVPLHESLQKQNGYQKSNAAVAAAILAVWELETGKQCLDKFDAALRSYFWPGRLQYFREQQFLLDGAHNQDGAVALNKSLDELFPSKKRCFVLCFYQSKDFTDVMRALIRPGDLVFASQTTGRRPVVPPTDIVTAAQELGAEARVFDSLEEALKAAADKDKQTYIRVASGSFASVTAGLKFLGYEKSEDSQTASGSLWQPA